MHVRERFSYMGEIISENQKKERLNIAIEYEMLALYVFAIRKSLVDLKYQSKLEHNLFVSLN